MLSRRSILGFYALLGVIGVSASFALGHDPFRTRALLAPLVARLVGAEGEASTLALDAVGVALGLVLAALAIGSARFFVARFAWARALQTELEPFVRGSSDGDLLVAALASGVAEEILFRGMLTQVAGVVLSSVVFGALHQTRGQGRVAWMVWATAMGVLFALLFVATGSLLPAIVAHVVTNAVNLRFMRDHASPPPPRTLASMLR